MKKLHIIIPIIIVLISAFIIFKPFEPKEKVVYVAPKPTPSISTSLPSGSEKIEIYAFHATQRCISCINIEKYIKTVVEEKFSQDLKSGKIIFKTVNIDLSENKKIATEYGVSGSALFLNAIKNGENNHEEDTMVWRLVTNEIKLKNYFEEKLKKLL